MTYTLRVLYDRKHHTQHYASALHFVNLTGMLRTDCCGETRLALLVLAHHVLESAKITVIVELAWWTPKGLHGPLQLPVQLPPLNSINCTL